MICKKCGLPLNISQYKENESYKSCPNCSKINGEEHVYFPYPDYFGTTPLRSSSSHHEGPQSHCQRCRGNGGGNYSDGRNCSDFK